MTGSEGMDMTGEARHSGLHTGWLPYDVVYAGADHTVVGTVRVLQQVCSPQLANRRDIVVYLPPSYMFSERRYPVLYMQDGQNLFDAATSYSGEWHVDETMEALAVRDLEAIVVAIPNAGIERIDEYGPFVDRHGRGGRGSLYVRWIVETLQPLIDRSFRTLLQARYTGIMGSSMGGLISMYAWLEHPERFGFAGAMSPSLWFGQREMLRMLRAASTIPGRMYLDVGTGESVMMVKDVRSARGVLRRKGFDEHSLRYVEALDAPHHESAWGSRFGAAVEFFLENVEEDR